MYRIGQDEIDRVANVINRKCLFKVNDDLKETLKAEEGIKAFTGAEHAILMTSGHAALVSALTALGVGPGDEVIVPAYTYIATAMAVVAVGAMPVIVDIDDTLTIDPEAVEKAITKHTKAIMPVHIKAFPCNMTKIMEIAKKHNLLVVEDACQADGGSFQGKKLGTWGDAGAFSFNFYKVIGAGEGGALITNRKDVLDAAMIYHDSSAVAFFGDQLADNNVPVFCGQEFRANEIFAAVMNGQIARWDGILTDLRANKKYIMDALVNDCKFIESNDIEGDCGTTIGIRFDDAEKAKDVATKIGGTRPYDTGKHVYSNWTPIMEKRGAFNPLMDPFKMEANKDIVPNYTVDMCQKSLDILAQVAYLEVDPDWTKEDMDAIVAKVKAAL